MAKQSFVTGQVLTAAQMTSLQQTAMLGGAASAKTASYTLVAADAGTAISMSNASATTITVNTALFAAGDTVQITNLGAGVCTITAGTATVNTSASLALAQYESGTLVFTSTSAAIFIKGAGAAAAGGANWSLLNSGGTALSGTQISITGISGKDKILMIVTGASTSSAGDGFNIRINTDTGSNYIYSGNYASVGSAFSTNIFDSYFSTGTTSSYFGAMTNNAASIVSGSVLITGGNATGFKSILTMSGASAAGGNSGANIFTQGIYTGTSTISSVQFRSDGASFDAGTLFVYASA